jgi:hypothetical protein
MKNQGVYVNIDYLICSEIFAGFIGEGRQEEGKSSEFKKDQR